MVSAIYINIVFLSGCLFVCLSVRLYPMNVKTTDPREGLLVIEFFVFLLDNVYKEKKFTIEIENGRPKSLACY